MARLRVLLVDDSHEFLGLVEQMLSEDSRVEVVGRAQSGREALEAVPRLKPDVVMMDLAMPDMNGLQTTRRLKEAGDSPRVVIMTCHGSKEYQAAASLAGADGFISKDELFVHIPALIDALLRTRGDSSRSCKQDP